MTERMVSGRLRIYLLVALFALTMAAWTGVLLRFGLIQGMPGWAPNYVAARHAHSHLMYFGWGTLGIMALIWAWLPELTGRTLPRGVHLQMGLTAVLSLLAYPAFWANGYGTTEVLGRTLPLGSMAAAVNGLPWFLFAYLYARATWNLGVRPLPMLLWDWALVLLLVASAGAMGLGIQVALDVESAALREASLHLFLDLFATGWFTLASLGLLWAWIGSEQWPQRWMPTQSVAILLGVTFVLGMSPALTPDRVFWIAAIANLAAAALLAVHWIALFHRRRYLPAPAQFGLLLFGLYLLTSVAIVIPGVWRWAAGTQMRVFYLHLLLLGWMSSTLLGLGLGALNSLRPTWQRGVNWLWIGGVSVMLAALLWLGLIGLLPVSGILLFRTAAWASLLPALAATISFTGSLGRPHTPVALASESSPKAPAAAD